MKKFSKRSDYTVSRCSQDNGGKEINGIVFAGWTRQQVASVSWHKVHKFGIEAVKKLNERSEYTVSRCSEENGGSSEQPGSPLRLCLSLRTLLLGTEYPAHEALKVQGSKGSTMRASQSFREES